MATLQYDFAIVGTRAIDRAFASIERRAVQHNMRMAKEFGGTGGVGRTGAGGGAAAGRQYGPSSNQLYRLAEQQRSKALAAERAAERAAAREKVRLDKWRQDMRNRHWQQEEANRRRAEAAEARASARAMAERRRASGALFGRVGNSVGSTLRAVGSAATGALAIGGGFMAASAVGQQMRETAMASQLANQAGTPAIKGQLLREAQSVRGFTGEEALGGMSAFVEKTGDLDAARGLMTDMSKIAIATGTNLEDLGRTAGQAFNVLADQVGPQKAIKQTSELLGTLAQMGSMGAVEISDLARDFGGLGAATRGFEGKAPDLLRTMGAFAQMAVAKGGAKGSAEASTAASRLVADMVGQKRKKFEAILGPGGIQSKTDKTKLRDPMEIMLDVLDKTGGDIMKTGNLFGGESAKIFRGIAAEYSTGESKRKGSGRAYAKAKFDEFAGAKLSQADLESRFKSRMADPDMQFKEVLRDFNAQVGSQLLPVVTKLIPEFAKLLPHVATTARLFGKLVESLAENPIMTIGRLIAAKVVLDIAAAHIGDRMREAMLRGFGGGGPLPGGAGGPGGTTVVGGTPSKGGSKLGNGLAIATTVLLGADVGMAIGNAIAPYIWDGFHKAQTDALNSTSNKSSDDYSKWREAENVNKKGGLLTDEQRDELSRQRKDLSSRIAVGEVREDRNPIFQGITDMFAEFTGLLSKDELARRQSDTATLGQLKQDLARISEVETSNTDRLIEAIKTNNTPLLSFMNNRPKQDSL